MSSKKKVLLKIIFLGNSGVGKTAILNQYVHSKFVEDHKATIGADFSTKEISVEDKLVTLQIWDTAGQERFQSLGTAFYRGADACVLVYDVTDEQSFKQMETWQRSFLEQAAPEDEANFPFLLLANKTDLGDKRVVERADGDAFARRIKAHFFETSAKNNVNIEQSIREIASIASERETVPIFSPEVAERIIKFEQNGEIEPPPTTCACSLI